MKIIFLVFSKGWYLYLVTVRWFGLRLFALSNVMLLATIAFSIPLVAHTSTLHI